MAKRKKKIPNADTKTPAPLPETPSTLQISAPAISVVIPMYNVENYVDECLSSLLAQTFQDFEVIIVDDCSDDNSVAVVNSLADKFNGRLKLTQTEKNSGGGGYIPRNIGLGLASGKYVYFADADDFLAKNALETLHAAAKEYDADVVYTAAHYWMSSPQKVTRKTDEIGLRLLEEGLEDKPTLYVDDQDKLLEDILLKNHQRTPWAKLIRRTLLTENNILFPKITVGGDALWTILVYKHAKRFVRLPDALYYLRRYNPDSVVKTKRPDLKYEPRLISGFIKWFETFNDLAGKIEYLGNNPELCSQTAKDYFDYFVKRLDDDGKQLCARDLRDILLRSSAKKNAAVDLTAPFLNILEENLLAPEVPPVQSTCAVSVIISLYNYEAYVGECLDSLLAQTFTDFEVIVVDDCSTDNSRDIVSDYAPKFDGRLTLVKTEQNSGGGGMPRNIGLSLAKGEYVFFMDADDALTATALEEMFTFANDYYADVVYCEKYFISEGAGQDFKDNIRIADIRCQKPPFVDEPTFETEDMTKRVLRAVKFNYWVTAWLRLVRRDLLLANDIKFLSLVGSNDVGWTYQVLFCSRRFLRVPNACYIRRVHNESVSFRERTVPDYVHKWMDRTIRSLKYMDDFMNRFAFFRENHKYRHRVLSHFVDSDFYNILDKCKKLEPFEVEDIFREKFGEYLGEHDVLVSMLCAYINGRNKRITRNELNINELVSKLKLFKRAEFPAVSVIIPMYNAKRFIGECLDSLLNQTFTNFEVIVVDDGSTDNSSDIVKDYTPKFDGRLNLIKTETNSGGGGYVPRNIGLSLAKGEYVFFMDADDFIMPNALETFCDAAADSDADVVYTTAYYELTGVNDVRRVTDDTEKISFAGEPTLTTEDPLGNLQSLLYAETMPAVWRKFIRRDFLIEKRITFPEISNGGDFIWTVNLYCRCERLLRIADPLYFYRSYNGNSVWKKQRGSTEQLLYRVSSFIEWARALNDLSDDIALLRKRPDFCHRALTLHFNRSVISLMTDLKRLYYKDIQDALCRELSKKSSSTDLTTLAFVFSNIVLERRQIALLQQRVFELEAELEQLKGKE